MKLSDLKVSLAAAALVSAAFWSGSASAGLIVQCVNPTDDAYMELSTNGSATITCWDSGDQANPGELPISESGPGTFNDGILNLPTGLTDLVAKSDGLNASFFNIASGSLTSGLTGSFRVDAVGSIALLFKSGRGQNDPSWWLYSVTGLAAEELFTWDILGDSPTNGLSHLSAYGGDTVTVPEPAALWLLGSGLALLAIARRRVAKPESVRS